MKKVKNRPITGTNTAMRPTPNVLTDAAATSRDAQKLVRQPPMPFQNPDNQLNVKTGTGYSGGISTALPKIASGLQHSNPGARALPSGGPVGQNRAINQSGQVFGRMGTSHPRRVGSQNLSKVKKGAAFYGE